MNASMPRSVWARLGGSGGVPGGRLTPPRALAGPRAARSAWAWAGGGLALGALIGLLSQAPARWLAPLVAQASAGRVQLIDAQGRWWAGSARLRLSGGAGDAGPALELPSRLNWRLHAGWLRASLSLQSDCCVPQPWLWHWAPGWGRGVLQADDALSHWRADWLTALGTPWNTLKLRGALDLASQGWALRWADTRWQLDGQLRLHAQGVSARLSPLPELGSYELVLGGGATPTLALRTLSGPLQLSGQGQWVAQRLRFAGEARAAAGAEAALGNVLNIIGRRSGARSVIQVGSSV